MGSFAHAVQPWWVTADLSLPFGLHRVHLTEKERNWAVPYPVHRPKIVLKVMVDVHYILETEQLYRKTGLLFFALSVALKNSFEFNTIDYLSLLLLHFKTYMDDEFHVAVERLGQGLQGEVVHWGEPSETEMWVSSVLTWQKKPRGCSE